MSAAAPSLPQAVLPSAQLGLRAWRGPNHAAMHRLAAQFAEHHAVHLPGFLSDDLWDRAQRYLQEARFEARTHEALDPPAVNLTVTDSPLLSVFLFALNDPAVVAFVRRITGCDPIGAWIGDFYRMVPGLGHHDTWHDDVDGNRLVAITINLSPRRFDGGALFMRERETGRVLWSFHNAGRGDAVVFRLAPHLQHWIEDVHGDEPKSAVAGWFQRQPEFWREVVGITGVPQRGSVTKGSFTNGSRGFAGGESS